MIKDCDNCEKSFDIFNEGMGHQFFTVCGVCWSVELKCREIGGVFTNEQMAQMREELAGKVGA